MAGLTITVVATESDAGVVVGGDGASAEEIAVAALVGEVALCYVDAVLGQILVWMKGKG
jgi:hypothetical protein